MMNRFALALLGLFVSAAYISADISDFQSFNGRLNYYSLNYSTGQISGSNPSGNFGPDIAWDATTATGFFRGHDLATAPPEEVVDWGDIADGTVVNGFQIGYVTDSTTPVDYQVAFYLGNGFGDASASLATFTLTGLPGSMSGGFEGFIIDVDLEGGSEFTITGPDLDAFAGTDFEYGYMPLIGAGSGTAIGPIIATGGFGEEDVFDIYEPGSQNGGGVYGGSFFFGGSPFAQFHMRLYTIPEPGSAVALALAGLGLVAVRRRK